MPIRNAASSRNTLLTIIFYQYSILPIFPQRNASYLLATEGKKRAICGKIMMMAIATMSMITKGMLAL